MPTKWTKFDLAHISNTLKVYNVRSTAPVLDVLAFLATEARQLEQLRKDWVARSEELLAEARKEAAEIPESSWYRRTSAAERVRRFEKDAVKRRREQRAYASLAVKLKAAQDLPVPWP